MTATALHGLPDPRLAQMRSNAPLSSWPPVADDKHAVLAAMAFQFDRSQWEKADAIVARQHRQLVTLAEFHATHCSPFAARLASAGLTPADLASPAGLARLPELTRIMVQSGDHRVAEDKLPKMHRPLGQVNTSGSTGEPVRVTRTALNRLHWLGLSIRFHLWAEADLGGRLAVIRANLTQHGTRNDWSAPMHLLWPTGSMLLIDIEDDVDAQLDKLVDFAPTSVLVYPSNLAALSERMLSRGIALPSVQRWRTLGETLTPDTRERLALASAAPVIDCYSSEELGYLALQCPDVPGHYHISSETLIVELVDDDGAPVPRGDVGRVLVTDLHNLSAPMIRYAIGDHAVAGPPCRCGRGLPTLTRIMGRTRNMIVKPDGSRHWPLTGYKQFRDIAPIRQYQFRQHAVDAIELRLITERPLTSEEEAALIAHVQWKLRHPFRIDLVYFNDRLPLGNNGKFEEFLSLI
jgi:phenylacetate-CoA ligase